MKENNIMITNNRTKYYNLKAQKMSKYGILEFKSYILYCPI